MTTKIISAFSQTKHTLPIAIRHNICNSYMNYKSELYAVSNQPKTNSKHNIQ